MINLWSAPGTEKSDRRGRSVRLLVLQPVSVPDADARNLKVLPTGRRFKARRVVPWTAVKSGSRIMASWLVPRSPRNNIKCAKDKSELKVGKPTVQEPVPKTGGCAIMDGHRHRIASPPHRPDRPPHSSNQQTNAPLTNHNLPTLPTMHDIQARHEA